MKLSRGLKIVMVYIVKGIFLLLFTGAVWQQVAEKNDFAAYPPPGKMVNVNDHRLHILIKGTGRPVVVLESASDGCSANWEWIVDEIAKTTTVCVYDRAGHGWSELANEPRDAVHIASDLHTLLKKSDLDGPFIMVGHSAGGLFVRAFQQQYPGEVMGMVLVDADNEKEVISMPGFMNQMNSDKQFAKNMSALSYTGLARLIFLIKAPAPHLPELQGSQIQSFWSSSKHWKGLRRELDSRLVTNAQVASKRKVLDIPIEIVSAGKQTAAWLDLQKDLSSLSVNSRSTIVENADHLSLVLNKEYADETNAAIKRIISLCRKS